MSTRMVWQMGGGAMKAHWHVATGIAGYGPDASDGYGMSDTLSAALDVAREDIDRQCDHLADTANALGDDKDYEGAWLTHKHAESLDIFRRNIDPERAKAPLYADDPALWRRRQYDLYAGNFPLALDVEDNLRLYVWECAEECDEGDL